MRFSRLTLNLLVITCLGVISWIHLASDLFNQDIEQQPLEDLQLPPLSASPWQHWRSREGIDSYWQAISAEQGTLRLMFNDGSFQQWPLAAQQWQQDLDSTFASSTTIDKPLRALLLQGPWDQQQMQLISAYTLSRSGVNTDADSELSSELSERSLATFSQCDIDFAAGRAFVYRHWIQPKDETRHGQIELPLRAQWQAFRLKQSQQMRAQWLSHPGQLDIQTDIAYHRPPADYFRQLYQALAGSQKTAVADYLDCRAASRLRSAGNEQP